MEDLISPHLSHHPVVAQPAYCLTAHIAADLSDPETGSAMAGLFDAVMDGWRTEIATCTLMANTPAKAQRLTKATAARFDSARTALTNGMPKHRYLHLYGAAGGTGDTATLPVFALAHAPLPMLSLDIAVPAADGRGGALLDVADRLLAGLPVISGAAGLGFRKVPTAHGMADFPPAHRRFRAALIPYYQPFSSLVRYDAALVSNKRMRQKQQAQGRPIAEGQRYDYRPGLHDIGWRTYIGAGFQDRLGPQEGLATAGVTVDSRASHVCVTIGPEPIWGDLNASEDVSAWHAAYAYLKPALADDDLRLAAAPCYSAKSPERMREARDYLNRFVPQRGVTT